MSVQDSFFVFFFPEIQNKSERGIGVYINTLEETPNDLFFQGKLTDEPLVAPKWQLESRSRLLRTLLIM